MSHDERDEATDDTVPQGVDEGSADTLMAGYTPTPLPPAPLASGELPTTRPLGRRGSADVEVALAPGDPSRYTVGALLGQGGMGEVLLAVDEHIGREVAVKRIRAANPTSEELSRFVREARVQGRLEHPAVVPVHDLGVDRDGRPYFVMKRLSGTDMGELLRRLHASDEADAAARRRLLLRAFVDVCLAVEFAHSRGIIHRDLKPANIMLGDFGEVYVLDWGVARAVTDGDERAAGGAAASGGAAERALEGGDTRVGTVLGTPPYMAPEQLAGDRAGPAADIYALGCILFEIAAGEQLHARTRAAGEAFEPVDARPSRRRPDSPPELDAVCERATRVEPEERYPSARAIGNAVQAFLDGDRDVAVRQELAQQHLAEAREALARGDGEQDRRDAMRAAGRALALDPKATEAADIVTHIMLTPPRTVPVEVERRLEAIDTETAHSQGRLAAAAMLGYLAFVPLLLWTGVRVWPVVAFVGITLLSVQQVWVLTRQPRISAVRIYLNACINAALIALICRMVGPFIIAPTLVMTTLMAYAAHVRFGRIQILAVIFGAAVAVPWGLEAAGVLPATYHFERGALVLSSELVRFSALPVQFAFAALLVVLVVVTGILSRTIALRHREATRRLELQAWHLRQIVPTAAP
ncbi:MAG TPA: serine/threonine-protein kinase [Kofleriaceae bacterium]|nr:serine/threonine-protein kinase [Kofleriaceae bacterium]